MKRLLGITLALASIAFVAPSSEAKTSELSQAKITVDANASPQWQRDRYGRRNFRRARVVTRSRVVRVGRRLYRETYRVSYLPNGRTDTRLITRVRIS